MEEKHESVLLVWGKYYQTLRTPGMKYVLPLGRTKIDLSVRDAKPPRAACATDVPPIPLARPERCCPRAPPSHI